MRPHRLRLTAFGPFAGVVEVDLDALAASGLFLLHGETGAGKTTLLDGLGFALFGRVPGARGEAKRLRSDHASADTRTEVQLEVTLGGRRVRVTRSPEQSRPKRRGTGVTSEPAKVLLEEQHGDGWQAVSTRVGEADRELADLVGMSAEQFFQVVLLPQGDFARFLRAGSDDRVKLLERLFSTDRFRAVEHWLAEQRRSTAAARDTAREAVGRVAARVAQVADVPELEQVPAGWAAELLVAAGAQARAVKDDAMRHQAALDQALAADEDARQLADRQARRRAGLAEQGRLQADEPAIAELELGLDAARRAAEVAGALDDAAGRERALRAAREQEQAARAALPTGLRGADADGLRDAREAAAQRLGRLDALRADAGRAAEEQLRETEARGSAQAAAAGQSTLRTELERVPAQRAELEQCRSRAQAAAVRLPTVEGSAQQRRVAAAEADTLAGLTTELAVLRASHLAARERFATAREHAGELREARIDGMVAELAATLVDHAPCPVCGALEHPDRSELLGARVSRDEEDDAAAQADRLRSAAGSVGEQVAGLAARCAELEGRVDAQDAGGLARQADELEREAAELRQLAADLPAVEAALSELDRQAGRSTARLATLAAEQVAADVEAESARARASAAWAAVAAHLDGAEDLDSALVAAHARTEQVSAALTAGERLRQAESEHRRAQDEGLRVAREAGFADVGAAARARRDPGWRASASSRTAAHRAAVLAVGAVLAEPDLDVALEPTADPAAAAAGVARVRAAHVVVADEAARLAERARQLTGLAPALEQALVGLVPLVERATQVRTLADLAAGQGANTLRMTLSAYVLAARLEEVAAVASERLLKMTQGRFTLVHTDTGRGSAKAGLGLLARDAWTGQDRETSTLSGGETFLASLALALGLADVVAAEAGGARTEALFVDEGFGTLDDQTLEEVMDVLDGLREGGRLVGVVSHVAELRQRIPAQVHVRKSRSGSEVVLVGC